MAQNPAQFNTYTTAAGLMPEHAECNMYTDPAIRGFLTSVKSILSMLDWLKNEANLSTGSILQLSQLATALSDMDGYSDAVMLIEVHSQLEQCCHLLTFLGSNSAMQLDPVAQVASELRTVIALDNQATAQQIQQVHTRSQAMFSSPEYESFVKHFAARDSALFDAYL